MKKIFTPTKHNLDFNNQKAKALLLLGNVGKTIQNREKLKYKNCLHKYHKPKEDN